METAKKVDGLHTRRPGGEATKEEGYSGLRALESHGAKQWEKLGRKKI